MSILLYRFTKFYLSLFISFFHRITQINPQNVPQSGPTILYGNHNNNLSDGVSIICSLARPVRVIAAAKQIRRPGFGLYLKASKVIGVERIEDIQAK